MDAERVRAIVNKFAHVEETVQWGENLVFWVGDKAIGGKMFALVDMDAGGSAMDARGHAVMSFSAGPQRYAELIENEGVIPAPYMARIHWVALEHWNAIEPRELAALLAAAHALTYAKLPQRTKDALALPPGARCELIEGRRELIEARRELIQDRRCKLAAAKAAESAAKKSSATLGTGKKKSSEAPRA